MNDRIKVPGYSQKVFYNDNIEYRNFSPDLVGFQLTNDVNSPLFTIGNFAVTTNLSPKLSKLFITRKFSNFITLSDLSVSLSEAKELLNNNAMPILNLDKGKLNNYALFGSLTEFIRVSLENIITKWPASLYMTPLAFSSTGEEIVGYTFEDYVYDELNEIATFKIDNNFITNRFQLNILKNGSILNTYNETNDLRNVTVNYESYAVLYNNTEYPVIGFTGATKPKNDYVYFKVNGNPFSGLTTPSRVNYHIKPKKIKEDLFFNSLPNFEYYLLRRDITPLYTASFEYNVTSDKGIVMKVTDSVTWPTSDGYNLDFETTDYENYAKKLLDIGTKNDSVDSNLMVRFLVSESITSFDTTPVKISSVTEDETDQKINKTLQIYGAQYDKINSYITGIAFANSVSYNKKDNTPDIYLKNIARVLGWELISSVVENNLLSNYVTTNSSTYSGMSVGLTPVEADIELWRRLILNSAWLWKSKGTRKAIEFLIKFIGAPAGLVNFNEYIYKADAPIDVELFRKILVANDLIDDITLYPIDSEGYPLPFPSTSTNYYQGNGLWYRETGGTGSTIDILTGNNPHVGPYDRGEKYLNQFRKLIENFSATTITSTTVTTGTTNLYTNYLSGTFDDSTLTSTTVNTIEVFNNDGSDISDLVVFTPKIIKDPNPQTIYNECGCDVGTSDLVLSLCVESSENPPVPQPCDNIANITDDTTDGLYVFEYYQYDLDGNQLPNNRITNFAQKECCTLNNGTPAYFNQINDGISVNEGYVCCSNNRCGCTLACNWRLTFGPTSQRIILIDGTPFLKFIQENNQPIVVTPDGCNCTVPDYNYSEEGFNILYNNILTPIPNVIDPFTNEIGFGCRVNYMATQNIINQNVSTYLYNFYDDRANGNTPCYNN